MSRVKNFGPFGSGLCKVIGRGLIFPSAYEHLIILAPLFEDAFPPQCLTVDWGKILSNHLYCSIGLTVDSVCKRLLHYMTSLCNEYFTRRELMKKTCKKYTFLICCTFISH